MLCFIPVGCHQSTDLPLSYTVLHFGDVNNNMTMSALCVSPVSERDFNGFLRTVCVAPVENQNNWRALANELQYLESLRPFNPIQRILLLQDVPIPTWGKLIKEIWFL
jgi:hypothetical protein